jgi:MFS family permease
MSTATLPSAAQPSAALPAGSDATHARVVWRLMPLLLICYVFAHLDRINIGFAKLQMSADLHFSDTVYGLGAGLFFVAYALFGVPSNLMLERVGPRRWIAFLMVTWGLLSTAMLLVQSAAGFYTLRLLLGVAEAGFFPGILVYINRWFPARRRAGVTALFAIAVPMAGVIGGPLSGGILEGFHDFLGLRGWQWMFLIEGLPVVLLGLLVWRRLPESFERVAWLSDEQKAGLRAEMQGEEQRKQITSLAGIFRDRQVWLLVAIYFAVMLAVNTLAFWMPSLIHGAGIGSDGRVGLLSALPYLAGCVFMIALGRSSDRRRERRWHLAVPLLLAAAGLALTGLAPSSAWLVLAGLVLAGMGASAALPMFWQLPPAFLADRAQAAGIALISSFGSIAAFAAPYFIGWMRDTTHSSSLALYLLAILIALGAALVLRTPAAVVNPR